MTVEEQLGIIRAGAFLDALRTQGRKINAGTTQLGITVEGRVLFRISGVQVAIKPVGDLDVQVDAGEDDGGDPLFTWKMPIAWMG